MANIYQRWFPRTDNSKDALRALVKQRCASDKTMKVYHDIISKTGFTNLQKWLRQADGHENISEANYFKVVMLGLSEGWPGLDERPSTAMLADFLHIGPAPVGLVHNGDATEYYEVYKYSFLARGYILRGLLTLHFEQGQIKTTEKYRIQSEVAKEFGPGEEDIIFDREGFLFKRSDNQYLMISHRLGSPNEIQTAYLSAQSLNHVLRGSFSDRHGDSFYAARIYMSYLRKSLAADRICAVRPSEIHAPINQHLSHELDQGIFIINSN